MSAVSKDKLHTLAVTMPTTLRSEKKKMEREKGRSYLEGVRFTDTIVMAHFRITNVARTQGWRDEDGVRCGVWR